MHSVRTTLALREVRIPAGDTCLYGDLVLPHGLHGLVLYADGSGSRRHSARNRQVAQHLQHAGRVLAGNLNACRRARICAPVKGPT